jgi:putative selenium metabolism hydrolase
VVKDILYKLINTKSYTGNEENIVNTINSIMEELGFDEIIIDEAGNIIGAIHGNQEGANILFDGHIDTVEADNLMEWHNNDPFMAYEEDGKIFGRGASDMKGAFAAMLFALSTIDRNKLKGNVYISGTVNEEVAEGYTIRAVTNRIKPDLVVIGEATQLNINIGQRGRGEISLTTYGISAHSSNPSIGINAVLSMNKAISAITEKNVPLEDVLGKGILVVTDIISSPYPGESVIPRLCKATFDRRVILNETKESIIEGLRNILDEIKEKDKEFVYSIDYAKNDFTTYKGYKIMGDKFYPPWKINEDNELLKKIQKSFSEKGLKFETGYYSFCTNGSSTCGLDCIETIGFGPGREIEAHITNEFIEVEQLEKAVTGYQALAYILS